MNPSMAHYFLWFIQGFPAHMITLEHIRVGENARVVGFSSGDRGYRQRLLAMGLTPGATFSVQRRAPLGDPIEIKVRNFKLTLRKGEAAIVEVERLS